MKKNIFGIMTMFCLFSSAAVLIYTGYLLDSNPDYIENALSCTKTVGETSGGLLISFCQM